MNIPTCYRCPLRTDPTVERWKRKPVCKLLLSKLEAVRGAGLTVIKFPCPTRDSIFQSGECVYFSLPISGPDGVDRRVKVDGVIMRRKGRKWLLYCNHPDISRHVINMYPDALRKTGEVKPLCRHCGLPMGVERPIMAKCEPWSCRTDYTEAGVIELPCEAA